MEQQSENRRTKVDYPQYGWYYVWRGSKVANSPVDFIENWSVQVRKGLLELCVLNALISRERYGYELVKSLAGVPGLTITEGTLYPLLSRLRLQGLVVTRLVESPAGPARKYYCLTHEGKRNARLMNSYASALFDGMRELNTQ